MLFFYCYFVLFGISLILFRIFFLGRQGQQPKGEGIFMCDGICGHIENETKTKLLIRRLLYCFCCVLLVVVVELLFFALFRSNFGLLKSFFLVVILRFGDAINCDFKSNFRLFLVNLERATSVHLRFNSLIGFLISPLRSFCCSRCRWLID